MNHNQPSLSFSERIAFIFCGTAFGFAVKGLLEESFPAIKPATILAETFLNSVSSGVGSLIGFTLARYVDRHALFLKDITEHLEFNPGNTIEQSLSWKDFHEIMTRKQ